MAIAVEVGERPEAIYVNSDWIVWSTGAMLDEINIFILGSRNYLVRAAPREGPFLGLELMLDGPVGSC
jgi:hypothetical protein